MKTTILAILVGMTFSSAVLADRLYKNNQQKEDVLYGYGQTALTPAQAPEMGGKFTNQDQREDQLHGYGETEASRSEPYAVRIGKSNNQQKEDLIHGYSN